MKKEYSNKDIVVFWKPDKCIHSGNCVRGLSSVFNPGKRPWINLDAAESRVIVDQIENCPSGALSYHYQNNSNMKSDKSEVKEFEVVQNGPLLTFGKVRVKRGNGEIVEREKSTAFCRCGASGDKPFCDGSHKKIDFKG